MKAEGNIFYPLVVQSQRGKERGAHSRYIISYHIVGIWTSWYEVDRWVVCVRTGEKEESAYNGTTLQKENNIFCDIRNKHILIYFFISASKVKNRKCCEIK